MFVAFFRASSSAVVVPKDPPNTGAGAMEDDDGIEDIEDAVAVVVVVVLEETAEEAEPSEEFKKEDEEEESSPKGVEVVSGCEELNAATFGSSGIGSVMPEDWPNTGLGPPEPGGFNVVKNGFVDGTGVSPSLPPSRAVFLLPGCCS